MSKTFQNSHYLIHTGERKLGPGGERAAERACAVEIGQHRRNRSVSVRDAVAVAALLAAFSWH